MVSVTTLDRNPADQVSILDDDGEVRPEAEVPDLSDEELDERCAQAGQAVVSDLLQSEAGPDADRVLDDATRLMLVLRDLERVGDHAVNVCARTLYMVEQDDELIY